MTTSGEIALVDAQPGGSDTRAAEPTYAREKIGIDANRPIDPKTGRIEPQIIDPDIIASTGAGWVRLNFILGPWSGPNDSTLHDGRTWVQTYAQIIAGFRRRGLYIYGLIGAEAMPNDPGDRFRDLPPHGGVQDEWLDKYVRNFEAIVEMFGQDVQAFESFNEPDDWHGQQRNWVHPGWFAILLQRTHAAVRKNPNLRHVRLISGPLQGLEANRNAAVSYLQSTYRAGKTWFGWGQDGVPIPFDGVGYHLYVKSPFNPDEEGQKRAVQTLCRRYLDGMHRVIRQEEGQDRPLYVSEVGWNSAVERREIERREQFQASSLRAGLGTVIADPLVEVACWFCTSDFQVKRNDLYYGLFCRGDLTEEGRKPAFDAFKALCEGQIEEEQEAENQYTNQQIINAFYHAAGDLGLRSRWSLLAKTGLSLSKLAADRRSIYDGLPIAELPNLTDAEKALVQAHLDAQVPGASATPNAFSFTPGSLASDAPLVSSYEPDIALELSLALQAKVLQELERNNRLVRQMLEDLRQPDRAATETTSPLQRLLAALTGRSAPG